jgi:3-oxoacyl-[acyl-carrier protein] reductase
MNGIENKIALVTGASRGIGRAIAIDLANRGARLVVNFSSNEAEAKKTIELMGTKGSGSRIMRFDVANDEEVQSAISNINDEMGSVDILVNNAGIAIDGLLIRVKAEDFDRQINTIIRGSFNCAKACSRIMIKNRFGRIINIGSVSGQMGNAGQCVYATAKAGLIGMTKALARELASRNILVNCITPGYIETDMTKDILAKGKDEIIKQIPLGRVGDSKDIAYAVSFLASTEASYITGQVLSVNGGLYI